VDRCDDLFDGSTRVVFSEGGNLGRGPFALDGEHSFSPGVPPRTGSALTRHWSDLINYVGYLSLSVFRFSRKAGPTASGRLGGVRS
jgi:hypothetical protein